MLLKSHSQGTDLSAGRALRCRMVCMDQHFHRSHLPCQPLMTQGGLAWGLLWAGQQAGQAPHCWAACQRLQSRRERCHVAQSRQLCWVPHCWRWRCLSALAGRDGGRAVVWSGLPTPAGRSGPPVACRARGGACLEHHRSEQVLQIRHCCCPVCAGAGAQSVLLLRSVVPKAVPKPAHPPGEEGGAAVPLDVSLQG